MIGAIHLRNAMSRCYRCMVVGSPWRICPEYLPLCGCQINSPGNRRAQMASTQNIPMLHTRSDEQVSFVQLDRQKDQKKLFLSSLLVAIRCSFNSGNAATNRSKSYRPVCWFLGCNPPWGFSVERLFWAAFLLRWFIKRTLMVFTLFHLFTFAIFVRSRFALLPAFLFFGFYLDVFFVNTLVASTA